MKIVDILDRPIAFQRPFVAIGAGITGALMLSQAVYWARRNSNEHGWFFKTQVEWEEETGLGRAEQETARKRLLGMGVLEEDRKGIPAKLFYRVNFEKLEELLRLHFTRNQDCGNPANKDAGNMQARLLDSSKPDRRKPANRSAGKPQSKLRKTTAETTTETTAENIAPGADAPVAPMVVTAGNGTVYEIPGDLRYPGEGTKSHKTWVAYAIVYHRRHGSWPIWNARVGGQIANFIEQVGEARAPAIAWHYVRHVHEEFVVKQMHPVKLLQADAQKWATQCDTGKSGTAEGARQADRTATNANTAEGAAELAIAMVAARRARAAGLGGDCDAE